MRHVCRMTLVAMVFVAMVFVEIMMLVGSASAQPHPATVHRLNQAITLLGGTPPAKLDTVLSAEFLQKVPPMQLRFAVAPMIRTYGACRSVIVSSSPTPFSVKAEGLSDSGYVYPISLTVSSNPPHLISGFFIGTPHAQTTSLDSILRTVEALPGRASLTVYDVSADTVIVSTNGNERLPIGSTFKLYVLGALQAEIAAGRRTWSDVVMLDSALRSLPTGVLQTWPHGSPVTLHTLAVQMISISDNTATDHLITTLGRSTVEQIQAAMGHAAPEVNVPFRTTRELFREKYGGDGLSYSSEPTLVDSIEWFATTTELCKAMTALHHQSGGQSTNPVLQILSVNPGLDLPRSAWGYVGYKGGSEPGTVNMTHLAQHRSGRWIATSITWTQLNTAVDVGQVASIIRSLYGALQQGMP